ncbi:hypothetical protein [Deinococcus misasensis]|uniref:hypothetical protein n=1 Tax=Deinococcus misasensis TaxID=392413 RepID=UPI00054FB540|nr:hypothetical protein [Deinococcus misasensis]
MSEERWWNHDTNPPKSAPDRQIRVMDDVFIEGICFMIMDSARIDSKAKSCTLTVEGAKRFMEVLGKVIEKVEQRIAENTEAQHES